ncbi:MAG: hypothetical protein V3V31_08735 [Methylococcales bacterium]
MIEKSDSKWVSLATVSILGQPPRSRKGSSTTCFAKRCSLRMGIFGRERYNIKYWLFAL